MSTIQGIECAVVGLSEFRAWFLEFDAARWDREIEHDAAEDRLDALAEEAHEDLRANRTRPL